MSSKEFIDAKVNFEDSKEHFFHKYFEYCVSVLIISAIPSILSKNRSKTKPLCIKKFILYYERDLK